MSKIILYDLPTKGRCACWSLNPWKTRLALNYKSLDYETRWTEYPDLNPTLSALGVEPDGRGLLTSPCIRMPDGTAIMDSMNIALALEKQFPEPSLHLDVPVLAEIQSLVPALWNHIRPVFMPLVPRYLLNPRSAEYFEETRAKNLGKTLAEFEVDEGGEKAWQAADETFSEITAILRRNVGPFCLGEQVSYADFMILGVLRMVRRLGEDKYERVATQYPELDVLYDASKQWLDRDDY